MWKKPSFFWLEIFCSLSFSIVFLLKRKPQMKMTRLKRHTHWYLIYTWADKDFNGTIVNRALSSLHVWSLKITLTVPFNVTKIQRLQFNENNFFLLMGRNPRCTFYLNLNFYFRVFAWILNQQTDQLLQVIHQPLFRIRLKYSDNQCIWCF